METCALAFCTLQLMIHSLVNYPVNVGIPPRMFALSCSLSFPC
nr:unnamed protein product [Callosobruchus analis]